MQYPRDGRRGTTSRMTNQDGWDEEYQGDQGAGESGDPGEEIALLLYEDDCEKARGLAAKLRAQGIQASTNGSVVTIKGEDQTTRPDDKGKPRPIR
jgi:hypothetical protein